MLSSLTVLLLSQVWPHPDAKLDVVKVEKPASRVRVVVDAGHGSKGNHGNIGCHCQYEADETLVEAHELARRLRTLGFSVLETRTTPEGPSYKARIAAIEKFAPHAVVSLHTDARADAFPREASADGGVCWHNSSDPGFSVLWSDEGSPSIVTARERLGRSLSLSLAKSGFGVYSGEDYGSLYRTDETPGCFIDARPMKQRVYFLRATQAAPVVIIETHHALDSLEMARWHDSHTHDAFAAAVATGLLDALKKPFPRD